MCAMRHNTDRAKAITRAMNAAKSAFGYECLITCQKPVDGAHILPRSLYPELAACEYNIVPLSRTCHVFMDSRPSIAERIEYLMNFCAEEKRPLLLERLKSLEAVRAA